MARYKCTPIKLMSPAALTKPPLRGCMYVCVCIYAVCARSRSFSIIRKLCACAGFCPPSCVTVCVHIRDDDDAVLCRNRSLCEVCECEKGAQAVRQVLGISKPARIKFYACSVFVYFERVCGRSFAAISKTDVGSLCICKLAQFCLRVCLSRVSLSLIGAQAKLAMV